MPLQDIQVVDVNKEKSDAPVARAYVKLNIIGDTLLHYDLYICILNYATVVFNFSTPLYVTDPLGQRWHNNEQLDTNFGEIS